MGIRIVLAEDNALMRSGISRLLAAREGFEVVGEAGSLDEALAAVDRDGPDVVVTDIRMPPDNRDEGLRVAAHVTATRPDTGVVVLSQHVAPEYAVQLLEPGTAGRAYLLKERVADVEELVRAIRTVHDGGSVVDPEVVEALVAGTRQRASPLDVLTPRELETLGHMARGLSNAAIAEELVLSERAVEKHSNAIFSKLHLTSDPDTNRRVAAVVIYLAEIGLAEEPPAGT